MLTLKDLQEKLENLKQKRFEIECSDDFAYTNGKINQINHEIYEIEQQIKELELKNDRKSKNH